MSPPLTVREVASVSCACDRAQEIRAERQRKALEAQQAEQRRLEEERSVCISSIRFRVLLFFYLLLTQNRDGHKGRKNHTNMCPEIEK